MFITFENVNKKHIVVMDLEFDNMNLLQASGFIFDIYDKKKFVYQLKTSFNFYIKRKKVGKYALKITGITPDFLNDHGIELAKFQEEFLDLISELDLEHSLFVSHGAKNDRLVLKKNGIKKLPEHSFCTHKNAAKILNRNKDLSLKSLAEEAHFTLRNGHDAYYDALATIAVFSYLKNKEEVN